MGNTADEKQPVIRQATFNDIDLIEDTYNEHFAYESAHGAVTVFRKDIYPTRQDAEKAIETGTLYVYQENDDILGSVIIDGNQPKEYKTIAWHNSFAWNEVMVIHLLLVRPSCKGKGIATSLVKYAMELARKHSCKSIRLDTGSQNIPAVTLYQKMGFQIAGAATMKVGGKVEHNEHLFLERVL